MSNIENFNDGEGILKLQHLVKQITTCFFCTNLNNKTELSATIMTAQEVDNEGNIWFFSGLDSNRNQEIYQNHKVQLFFSNTAENFYLEVTGNAKIVVDKAKMKELWSPFLKIWFKDGIEDPNICLIKVATENAHYWDNEGGKMINFVKMMASVLTGNDYIDAKEGTIKI